MDEFTVEQRFALSLLDMPNPSRFESLPLDVVLTQMNIPLFLDKTQKKAEIIALTVKTPYYYGLEDELARLRNKGDKSYRRLEDLIEAQVVAQELDEREFGAPYEERGTEPKDPYEYVYAGVNEGTMFTMATLGAIPQALEHYNAKKGLGQPTPQDILSFAKNQGLEWIRMHSVCYKYIFFAFFRSLTSLYAENNYMKHAPLLDKPYFVIADHPKTAKPALAYDVAQLDDNQKFATSILFSQTAGGPKTNCSGLRSNASSNLYLNTVALARKANFI